jgi:hypothetical protein
MTMRSFHELAAELEASFAEGVRRPWSDAEFNQLALACFSVQYTENVVYRQLCTSRGVGPDTVRRWQDVPLVPATAFKHLDLVTGPQAGPEAVYLTSGTTRGGDVRGRHLVRRLSLYRASALPNFVEHLLPGGERLPLLSLIPSRAEVPASSLSAMMGMVADELCVSARWAVDASGKLDLDAVREGAADGPCLIAGTAFAFVHLLDALAGELLAFAPGTRVMETGGFKGRAEAVSRDVLYQRMSAGLGVPAGRIVNEYGMTELLSQLYEPVLESGEGDRRHNAPPWLRVRALDPVTLEERSPGEDGLLAFFDLANLGSVCHVLTEDVGSVAGAEVLLRGRAVDAEPRGCSRAMDELMTVTGRTR